MNEIFIGAGIMLIGVILGAIITNYARPNEVDILLDKIKLISGDAKWSSEKTQELRMEQLNLVKGYQRIIDDLNKIKEQFKKDKNEQP